MYIFGTTLCVYNEHQHCIDPGFLYAKAKLQLIRMYIGDTEVETERNLARKRAIIYAQLRAITLRFSSG